MAKSGYFKQSIILTTAHSGAILLERKREREKEREEKFGR